MRVPTLIDGPLVPVNWENAAELGTLTAGAWVILATLGRASVPLAGAHHVRPSLVAFGVAHFAYVPQTAGLIPAVFPFHTELVYFTGTAHCAAGLGVLFSVLPRLAARLEAAMLAIFTLAVWVPALFAPRISLGTWTEFVVSVRSDRRRMGGRREHPGASRGALSSRRYRLRERDAIQYA